MIDIDGHIKLADFGLSKRLSPNQKKTFSFCGSPEYLTPEMLRCEGHDYSVDYYTLGALLYEMLVGLPPFYKENQQD